MRYRLTEVFWNNFCYENVVQLTHVNCNIFRNLCFQIALKYLLLHVQTHKEYQSI